jgi:cytoskeleton protein RodZ
VDGAEDTTETRPLGQEFAAERERLGLSRAEAAQRMHMSAWQVEALEGGDYARLPQGTFLRGFVRNYAKVLALDPDAMLERLAQSAPRGTAPRIVVPSQNIRFDPLGERLSNPYIKAGGLAVAFIAFGFAAMYWWLFIRPMPPGGAKKVAEATPQNIAAAPMPAVEPVVPRSAPTEASKIELPRPEPAKPEPAKPELAKVEPPKPEPPKAEAPRKPEPPKVEAAKKPEPPKPEAPKKPPEIVKVSSGLSDPSLARTLKLRFKGESWVEIRDRSGKILFSRINSPGSEAEVSGRPPFNVVIGNAPDVQVLYEDREFPLEPHTKVAVARFTVE